MKPKNELKFFLTVLCTLPTTRAQQVAHLVSLAWGGGTPGDAPALFMSLHTKMVSRKFVINTSSYLQLLQNISRLWHTRHPRSNTNFLYRM